MHHLASRFLKKRSHRFYLFNKLLIHSEGRVFNVEKMVEVKSPILLRDIEGRFGILFKLFVAEGSKKELLDTNKIVAINLKKEESILLVDKNDNFWELFRNRKGHYNLKRLKSKSCEN